MSVTLVICRFPIELIIECENNIFFFTSFLPTKGKHSLLLIHSLSFINSFSQKKKNVLKKNTLKKCVAQQMKSSFNSYDIENR